MILVIHWQTERTLGNERVAPHGFERRGDTIVRGLVVAAGHPYFTLVLHTDLRRTDHMSSGMKAETNAVDLTYFAVRNAFHNNVVTKPMFQNGNALGVAQVGPHSNTRMIAVCMSDDRTIHHTPRINVDTCGCHMHSIGGEINEGHNVGCKLERMLWKTCNARRSLKFSGAPFHPLFGSLKGSIPSICSWVRLLVAFCGIWK